MYGPLKDVTALFACFSLIFKPNSYFTVNNSLYCALQKKCQLNDGNSLFSTKTWKLLIIAQYDGQ